MRKGCLYPRVITLIIATVTISVLALVGWVLLFKPDIEHHLAAVPQLPFWVYPFVGIGFAVLNATMEETVFRGLMMEALDSALDTGYWSVDIQAIAFGALHFRAGFPSGILGFIMVFIYGVMLGTIRRQSRGMLAPVITHFLADLTIFSILVVILLY